MQRISSKANRILLKRDGIPGNIFSFIALTHSQASPNKMLKRIKTKDELDSVEDALILFDRMLRLRPLPSVVRFNQLLGKLAKMKRYSGVISLYNQMDRLGITPDDYSLNIVLNCFCHLKHMPFSLSVLGKRGFSADASTAELFVHLISNGELDPSLQSLFRKDL